MADEIKPFPGTNGANMPRWKRGDARLFADRIYHLDGNTLRLESGTRVDASDDLLKSGPARYGDFYTFDPMTGNEALVAGADFQTSAVPIPHALDVAGVSADTQPGFRSGEPESGSPDDPMAEITGAPAVGEPPVASVEAAEAQKHDDEHHEERHEEHHDDELREG